MRYQGLLQLLLFVGWGVFATGDIFAQSPKLTVTTNIASTTQADVNLEIDNLPDIPDNITVYHAPSFLQGFYIPGDGNFIRLDDLSNGTYASPNTYPHSYLPYTNQYPAALIIIDRKSGDDPPGAAPSFPDGDQTIPSVNLGSNFSGVVEVIGGTPPADLVKINPVVPAPSPIQSPLITAPNEKIGLTYSHYAEIEQDPSQSRFYLKDQRIGAFAIAYKPVSEGKIFFFYDSHDAGTINFDHKQVQFQVAATPPNPPDIIPSGTLIPNYSTNISGLLSNMNNIVPALPPFNPGIFEKVIPYKVTSYETTAFSSGGNVDELRLFHLLKNLDLQNTTYQFVAAYYTDENQNDSTNYEADRLRLLPYINLPVSYVDAQGKTWFFADAAIMEIKKGEPDDPNKLTIENICKCNGDYRVKFKLKYCNNSTSAAPGANVMLDSYKKKCRRIMDCIQLKGISPDGLECCERRECAASGDCCFRTPSGLRFRDKKYCIQYEMGHKLAAGKNDSCGTVEFTARIAERDLHLLKERSVMHYCVNLHGHTDKQFICGWNEILRDSTFDEDNQGWQTNPIWTNRAQDCPAETCRCPRTGFFKNIWQWIAHLFSHQCC